MSNTDWLLWLIGAVFAVLAAIRLDQRAENERQAQQWREDWNERTGIHPADDPWDDWELMNRYKAHKREKGD